MSNTYEKWNKLELETKITWREVLGTIAVIAVILFIIGLIDSLT